MAQFDVYVSPGRNRAHVPYVVDVQSARYQALPSRLVMPLMGNAPRDIVLDSVLVPEFLVAGRQVFLNPFETQAIRRSVLGAPVGTLAGDGDSSRIIAAIDAVITRAYG